MVISKCARDIERVKDCKKIEREAIGSLCKGRVSPLTNCSVLSGL